MMKFELFNGKDGQHYFRLLNEKGNVLLSSEGYKQKDSALNGISSVKTNIVNSENWLLKTSESGKHYFNLKATNGQIIGTSTMFDSPELRTEWMKKMSVEIPKSEILEMTN